MIHLVTPLIVFVFGAAYEGVPMDDVIRGNNRFAVELLGQVRDQPGNLFFSPSSISTALAMTYAGARTETAREMAKALHFTLPQERLHPAFASMIQALESGASKGGYRLSVANRLWGQKGYHYRPEFLATTREQYGAELAEVDFAASEQARQAINAWISEKTEGKILDLIPSGVLDGLTRLVLTNAIYFKGTWSEPFPKASTREAPFHVTVDETTKAPLMQRQGDLRFWAGEGLKVAELPYAGGTLGMTVLLPDAIDGLPALEAGLTDQKLTRWLSGLRSQKVAVALPRFKMTSEFSLGQTLAKMGMPLAFDQKRADFSGITSVEPLYIGAVIHKAFVDVNEEGTEAAAATGVVMKTRAAMVPQPVAVFRADHPFLFLIRDLKSGSILFLGRVINPSS
jgi:serine protease inhibitor